MLIPRKNKFEYFLLRQLIQANNYKKLKKGTKKQGSNQINYLIVSIFHSKQQKNLELIWNILPQGIKGVVLVDDLRDIIQKV